MHGRKHRITRLKLVYIHSIHRQRPSLLAHAHARTCPLRRGHGGGCTYACSGSNTSLAQAAFPTSRRIGSLVVWRFNKPSSREEPVLSVSSRAASGHLPQDPAQRRATGWVLCRNKLCPQCAPGCFARSCRDHTALLFAVSSRAGQGQNKHIRAVICLRQASASRGRRVDVTVAPIVRSCERSRLACGAATATIWKLPGKRKAPAVPPVRRGGESLRAYKTGRALFRARMMLRTRLGKRSRQIGIYIAFLCPWS